MCTAPCTAPASAPPRRHEAAARGSTLTWSETTAIAADGAPGGSEERIWASEMLTKLLLLLTVICNWLAPLRDVVSALLPGGLACFSQTGSDV